MANPKDKETEPPSDPSVCTYTAGDKEKNVAWKGIRDLWERKLLCDVHLVAEGRTFQVHRCILASCSEYFSNMFTKGFKESTDDQVHMQAIKAKGLEAILMYVYTGRINVSLDNIEDVLNAAAHMQISDVLKFCTEFIKTKLTAATCLEFYRLCNLYAMEDVAKNIKRYMTSHYGQISETLEFPTIPIELLCELLAGSSLQAESELCVFKSAVQWLKADPERSKYAERVLKLVQYELLTSDQMQEVYRHDNYAITKEPACREILNNALDYHMNIFQQPIKTIAKAYPRPHITSVLVVGGCRGTRQLMAYASIIKKKRVKGGFLEIKNYGQTGPRYHAAVVVLNNFFFVAGGDEEGDKRKTTRPTNAVSRYNPRDGKWLQIASMNEKRKCFSLVAAGDSLLAIGGRTERNRICASVEKYNFSVNEWSYAADMSRPIYDHAGCAYREVCYVSGGYGEDKHTSELLLCYDPVRQVWQQKSPMNQARAGHVMVCHEDTLLVCGGCSSQEDDDEDDDEDINHIIYVGVYEVEMYDIKKDQWTLVKRIPRFVSKPVVAQYQSYVFIIGGADDTPRRVIQCYDIRSDKWVDEQRASFPMEINVEEMGAGCVQLPADGVDDPTNPFTHRLTLKKYIKY